jgi:hypothetical protein
MVCEQKAKKNVSGNSIVDFSDAVCKLNATSYQFKKEKIWLVSQWKRMTLTAQDKQIQIKSNPWKRTLPPHGIGIFLVFENLVQESKILS